MSTVADATIQILVYAESLKSKVTALKLIDALLGKGPCKISSWKKPPANTSNKVSFHEVKSFHHFEHGFSLGIENGTFFIPLGRDKLLTKLEILHGCLLNLL